MAALSDFTAKILQLMFSPISYKTFSRPILIARGIMEKEAGLFSFQKVTNTRIINKYIYKD